MDPPRDPDQPTSLRPTVAPLGLPAEVADTGLGIPGCEFTLTATPASPSVARDHIRRWLRRAGWPPEPLEEVVYAVSEAVSNAIEHAYPPDGEGIVEVTGWMPTRLNGQRRALVKVGDHGRWRPIPLAHEGRRRGIPLMRSFMDTVVICRGEQPTAAGTEVLLISRPVPPHPDPVLAFEATSVSSGDVAHYARTTHSPAPSWDRAVCCAFVVTVRPLRCCGGLRALQGIIRASAIR
jgi:anti-sigma regulatory factor (Ser/Thr protein kinase)